MMPDKPPPERSERMSPPPPPPRQLYCEDYKLLAKLPIREGLLRWDWWRRDTLRHLVDAGYATLAYDWRIGRLVADITEEGAAAIGRNRSQHRTRLA